MMDATHLSSDGRILTVRVPMAFIKRGGRKLVVSPDRALASMPVRPRLDNSMVKAIARAFRWRKLLEDGVHSTLSDLSEAEKINPSYVSRILRLTLLAPQIVEEILDGRQRDGLTLSVLMKPFPLDWSVQKGTRQESSHQTMENGLGIR